MTVQSGGEQQSGAVLRQTGQTDVAVLIQQRGQTQTPAEAKHRQTQPGQYEVGLFGRTLAAARVSGRPAHRLRFRLELEVRLVLGDVRQQIQLRDGVKGGQQGGEGGGGWGEWEHEERLCGCNDRMQCAWQKDMVECAGKEKGREKHNISQ